MIGSGHFLFFHQEMLGIFQTKKAFAVNVPIIGRIKAVFWMIHSVFLPIDASVEPGYVVWKDVTIGWSILGIVIFLILMYGFVRKYRETLYQVALSWVLFAFILFVPLNWAVKETPLFNIMFHWAVILLFVSGLDGIIEKVKWNKKIVYSLLCVLNLIVFVMDVMCIMTQAM